MSWPVTIRNLLLAGLLPSSSALWADIRHCAMGMGGCIFSCPVKQSKKDSTTKNNVHLMRKAMTNHVWNKMFQDPVINDPWQIIYVHMATEPSHQGRQCWHLYRSHDAGSVLPSAPVISTSRIHFEPLHGLQTTMEVT
jgi:hypothetical protein